MKISRMSQGDLDQVTKLSEQLGYPNSFKDIQGRFQEITNLPNFVLFVAKDEDQVLGWIQVNQEAISLVVGPKAEISALVVDEIRRSQGIGAKLVQKAEEWARDQGFSLVRVRSNVKREAAHRFYQRAGYSLNKTGHIFSKSIGFKNE